VITAIAGRRIRSNTDLRNAIGLLRIGDQVTIDLLSGGRPERRHAVLANTLADAPGINPSGVDASRAAPARAGQKTPADPKHTVGGPPDPKRPVGPPRD
jgi:hypothetical protein